MDVRVVAEGPQKDKRFQVQVSGPKPRTMNPEPGTWNRNLEPLSRY